MSQAYEALYDPDTRRIYDQHGHEGLERHKAGAGAGHAHDPFDLFSRFFGGGGHFGHGGGQRRGPNMEVRVELPLQDFYNGNDHDFNIEKQMICEECEGSGSADGQVEKCSQCNGQGMVIQKHMLAPGIFQQMQSPCGSCAGKGHTIKHPCKVCGGSKVVRKTSTHSLHVERGMPKGARVTYENEADESPDWVAGDLIVTLDERTPAIGQQEDERRDGSFFRRKGKDVFWKEVLSLREAWLGDWTRNLTHLDGHTVTLSRGRGHVIQPNMIEVLPNEGMPVWHDDHDDHPDEHGALYVEYTVVLPDQMDPKMEQDIAAVWERWRTKSGVDLGKDSGRPLASEENMPASKDEL